MRLRDRQDRQVVAVRHRAASDDSHQASADEISLLCEVSAGFVSSLELERVLQAAVTGTVRALHLETGAIYLLAGNELELGATYPPLPPEAADMLTRTPRKGHAHIEQCLALRQPVYVADASRERFTPVEQAVVDARGLKSILYVPIAADADALGVMIVGTQTAPRRYPRHDADLCQALSCQIALAVTNARLYGELRAANAELARHRDHLEEIIEQRTRELEDALRRKGGYAESST